MLGGSDDPGDLRVTNDDEQGARLAVEHLVAVGRTRLAYVSGPRHHLSTSLRQQGFVDAVATAGSGVAVVDVALGRWSEAGGRTAAGMLLRRPPGRRVDGVLGSWIVAQPCELVLRGLSVPG